MSSIFDFIGSIFNSPGHVAHAHCREVVELGEHRRRAA